MGVFKYLAEILKQFSVSQRVFALLLMLIFSALVILGPKLIDAFIDTNEELTEKVVRQKLEIAELNSFIVNLNGEIRNGQISCTNEIIDREREILGMLDSLERIYRYNKKRERRIHANTIETMATARSMSKPDTILSNEVVSIEPVQEIIILEAEDKTAED